MTGRSRRVLVLGAYGQVGRVVVEQLRARTGVAVLATGRDPARLRALGGEDEHLRLRALDLADGAALARACGEASLVINCVGPYLEHGERAARSALEAGAAYLDVASEQEHFRRLVRLDPEARRRGVALVTGAGLYPGFSGLLLAALRSEHPDARRAEVALAAGRSTSADAGSAALVSALFELSHPLEELADGRLRVCEPGAPRVRRVLPAPFGPTELISWPQLEVLAAAHAGGIESLGARIALAGLRPLPPVALRVLRGLAPERRPWLRGLLRRPAGWLHRRAYHSAEARRLGTRALVAAEVAGAGVRHRSTFAVPDGARATAWLPVLLAGRALDGGLPGGVATAMDLVALDEAAAWLRRRGQAFELCVRSASGAPS